MPCAQCSMAMSAKHMPKFAVLHRKGDVHTCEKFSSVTVNPRQINCITFFLGFRTDTKPNVNQSIQNVQDIISKHSLFYFFYKSY